MAFHSGFSGQRAVQTWSERIKILDKLGFINVAAGPTGMLSYAIILNPYKVVKRIFKETPTRIRKDLQNALHERAIEIGATDLEDEPAPPDPKLTKKPATSNRKEAAKVSSATS